MKKTLARAVRSRVVKGVTVSALVSAAAFASLAMAHNRVISNSVTMTKAKRISPALGVYSGRVLSGNARCKRHREVQVYRVDVTPDVRLFTTFTTPNGFWRRKGPAVPRGAKVQALIETKVLVSNAAHDHTCAVDRSPVRKTPYP